MQTRRLWQYAKLSLLIAIIFSSSITTAHAQTSTSSNYQVTETQFGGGTNLQNCSASYCARASIGDMSSGGKSKSTNSSANFGSNTPGEPLLEVIVDPGVSDLGDLTTDRTATKTMSVRIRNYLSEGYTLQIVGTPPKYKNHTLKTPSVPTLSIPGTEQFAINAVANTTPTVGNNPVQVPSGQTSFGQATDDYKTPNRFMYRSGDVVGRSTSESGRTDYTVSMIINVANSTPAGHYNGEFAAVVTPVY